MPQRRWRWRSVVMAACIWGCVMPGRGFAAETVAETPTKTTQVILILDTQEQVKVRTRVETQPPGLVLEFPGQKVFGSLPERSVIRHGVISEIRTHYRVLGGRASMRLIESVRIGLTGPYAQRVHTKPGQIIIEIDHPVGVMGQAIEIGLLGGTVLSGLARQTITDRFRAMEHALSEASTARWTRRITPSSMVQKRVVPPVVQAPRPSVSLPQPSGVSLPPRVPQRPYAPERSGAVPWRPLAAAIMVCGAGVALWWFRTRQRAFTTSVREMERSGTARTPATGFILMEQLVWRAFERQGYRLINIVDVAKLQGRMRVISKDETKYGLLCLMNGPFFERNTVNQFLHVMRRASLEQGFIVAAGTFTVPAKRKAKGAHVTLIGREELMELLSAGAITDYFSKQLDTLHARLDESKTNVDQYARELETMRRQRNEASWILGEERIKRSTLEEELSDLAQQLSRLKEQDVHSKEGMAHAGLQWEEGQWNLGEAKARIRYLEEQLQQLQQMTQPVKGTRRKRQSRIALREPSRIYQEQLTVQLGAVSTELKESVAREHALHDQLDRMSGERDALQTKEDRRRVSRGRVSDATVELRDQDNRLVCAGDMRDLSGGGIGFDSERPYTVGDPLMISLRLPGRLAPITSNSRLVWQERDERTHRYRSGFRFVDLSAEDREEIERALEPISS